MGAFLAQLVKLLNEALKAHSYPYVREGHVFSHQIRVQWGQIIAAC
jgi:hypothetical protein